MSRYKALAPSASRAPSSPNALVGDPALGTLNIGSATRKQKTGFPPKTRGNDGNAGGGL